jgi:hypothetical protein
MTTKDRQQQKQQQIPSLRCGMTTKGQDNGRNNSGFLPLRLYSGCGMTTKALLRNDNKLRCGVTTKLAAK